MLKMVRTPLIRQYAEDTLDKPVVSRKIAHSPQSLRVHVGMMAGMSYTTYTHSVRVGGTAAWRNNNPGVIRPGSFAQKHGAIGQGWGLAIFPDEATGMNALLSLLQSQTYAMLTVRRAIFRYIPAGDSSDPTIHARAIETRIGIDLNRALRDLSEAELRVVAATIRAIEGWQAGTLYTHSTHQMPHWVQSLFEQQT